MTVITEDLRKIPLDQLRPDPQNPRTDLGDLAELVASIKAQGVVEPIVVRPENGKFLVVAGRRRFAAAMQAGLLEIAAVVRPYTDAAAAAASLIENLQRKDLNPLEEAQGYKSWLDLTKRSQEDLAKAVGKARPTIANALRLLEAPERVQLALERGTITAAHARVLLTLPEKALEYVTPEKGESVGELQERVDATKRSFPAIEKLREAIAAAEKAGKVVTWDTRGGAAEIWLAGQSVDLRSIFGEPKKKQQGYLRAGYGGVDAAVHAQACECNAVAIDGNGRIVPACVSPTGWKLASARADRNLRRASPTKKKAVQTKAAKAALEKRNLKVSTNEAAKVYAGKAIDTYHGLLTKVDDRFARGGLAGEPARLALFGILAKYAQGRGTTWKVELWKKIATAPLKDVRERVARYVLGIAFREIADASRYGDKYGNTRKIRELVNAHYRARKAAKPKKARR